MKDLKVLKDHGCGSGDWPLYQTDLYVLSDYTLLHENALMFCNTFEALSLTFDFKSDQIQFCNTPEGH